MKGKKKIIILILLGIVFTIFIAMILASYAIWRFTGSRYFETMTSLSFPRETGSFMEGHQGLITIRSTAYMKLSKENLEDFIFKNRFRPIEPDEFNAYSKLFFSSRLPSFLDDQNNLLILHGKNCYGYPYEWVCIVNINDASLWVSVPHPDPAGH